MPQLSSAYNFVPLNEQVFFPEPPDSAPPSQDTPYSDGLCGTIKLQIKATTPLYIRGAGHFDKEHRKQAGNALGQKYDQLSASNPNAAWQDALDAMTGDHAEFLQAYTDFYELPDDSYAVPWSEVKGMIRSVVEIASWGKLRGVSDEKMSFRELHNPRLYRNRFTRRDRDGFHSKAKAGWITMDNEQWVLTPCDYARVEIDHLEEYFRHAFSEQINLHEEQSAPAKYRKWGASHSRELKFQLQDDLRWNHDKERWDRQLQEWVTDKITLCYRLAKQSLGSGSLSGTIVMVGQPDTYLAAAYQQDWLRRKSKKHMEFIFYAERSSEKKSISAALRQDFESAHQLPPGEDEDDWAWGYWRNELKKPGARIPVFYLESGGRIEHFGLAQLFRINYRHTLQQRLPDDHKSARPDMAELIFGPMGRSEKFWRGRVSGQPFVAVGNPQPAPLEVAVLGTPRPSFYPNYLEQPNPQQGYKTLEDNDAGLRGWKRFPVPSDGVRLAPNPPIADQGRHKMGASTYFRPLPPGTTFTGEISFHNLRPWELGALLWALGFGKTVTEQPDSNLRHSLGMAKPLGGGAVLLTVTGIEATNAHGAKEEGVEATALTAFGERMASSCAGGSWETSSRMNELLLMADQSKQPSNPQALSHPREVKYFADFKKNREALVPFSKLPGVQQ